MDTASTGLAVRRLRLLEMSSRWRMVGLLTQ